MKLTLRKFTIEDAPRLVEIANNSNISKFMKDLFPHPYLLEHAHWFIEVAQNEELRYSRAIVLDGILCGSIGLHFSTDILRNNAEIGYWLAEDYWRKGIMHRAINEMVTYGFKHYPINRIYARVYGNNLPSQKVLSKSGFKLEAKFDQTIVKHEELLDEIIFAIRK